jgi:uncharacterized protein (DUF983 family)
MSRFWELLLRGLMLRCPVCGEGKLFRGFFKMYEYCPACEYRYEREEGYFTSAMAINIVISEFIVTAFTLPLAANVNIPMWPVLGIGGLVAVLLPFVFYKHSRSLWLSMDLFLNPLRRQVDDEGNYLPHN